MAEQLFIYYIYLEKINLPYLVASCGEDQIYGNIFYGMTILYDVVSQVLTYLTDRFKPNILT